MKFTVVWDPKALGVLAQLWTESLNRQDLADAADQIDRELGSRPEKGEKHGKFYWLKRPPLAVLYHLAELDRMVRVFSVRLEKNEGANEHANHLQPPRPRGR